MSRGPSRRARPFNQSDHTSQFFERSEVNKPLRQFPPSLASFSPVNGPCSSTAGSAFDGLGACAAATMSLANKFTRHCGGSTLKAGAL